MNDESMQIKIETTINQTMLDLDLYSPEDEDAIVDASFQRLSKEEIEWLAKKEIEQKVVEIAQEMGLKIA